MFFIIKVFFSYTFVCTVYNSGFRETLCVQKNPERFFFFSGASETDLKKRQKNPPTEIYIY